MNLPTINRALRYHSHGQADAVLALEENELPELQSGEALLRVLAAPVNPADFGRIAGTYGDLAPLPATAGLEGLAEILEIRGDTPSDLKLGARVFIPSHVGSWQSFAVTRAEELFPAPENLPFLQAAMGRVNPPTAWKLLHDFMNLKAGDIVVQNAATSAVGKLMIQIARHLGIRTINLVRSLEAKAHLESIGADIVLLDNKDAPDAALEATRGQKTKLALNSVGGSSAYGLCKLLADGGTLVTFGGMDQKPSPFPTRYLIFNDIQLRGFWVSKWYENASRRSVLDLHNEVFTFMKNANISVEVAATYPLDQYQTALAHAIEPGKRGKILFDMTLVPEVH